MSYQPDLCSDHGCVRDATTTVLGARWCVVHTPEPDSVGDGTTTLDWLMYKYPWLKDYITGLKRRIRKLEDERTIQG